MTVHIEVTDKKTNQYDDTFEYTYKVHLGICGAASMSYDLQVNKQKVVEDERIYDVPRHVAEKINEQLEKCVRKDGNIQ